MITHSFKKGVPFPALGDMHVIWDKILTINILSKQSWLKPGGQLLITDYCCCSGQHSEQFKKYLEQRQYHLIDVESYGKVIFDSNPPYLLLSNLQDIQRKDSIVLAMVDGHTSVPISTWKFSLLLSLHSLHYWLGEIVEHQPNLSLVSHDCLSFRCR